MMPSSFQVSADISMTMTTPWKVSSGTSVVSVQKARTALFFSNNQLAMSARSVGFLAQRFFPPGIDGTIHGPYFGFQEAVTLRTSVKPGVVFPRFFPGNPNVPNGITIFPGGFPLYRSGQLIGAVGVSGDGVDQDDKGFWTADDVARAKKNCDEADLVLESMMIPIDFYKRARFGQAGRDAIMFYFNIIDLF